ncbi:MAG: DUF503 domain-containing protein [Candidatus Omnitrophica bacterium]|nr:DUF503 domain-containing protein [Candidatus Omnitrophota bacterium]MDD5552941.1 DUF503 domain-containing protein [Candidatus Omnitrophota bacterium]
MTVGILRVNLFIHESNSLKEKRMVLHSLKARLRNSFNVAVTQIDEEDKWQRATLAVVGVEKDRDTINSILSNVVNFIGEFKKAELIDSEMELI